MKKNHLLISLRPTGLVQLAFALLLILSQNIALAEKQNCSAVSDKTCTTAHALKKGINLGNMLDAPWEGAVRGLKVEPEYFDLIAENFNTVRIPIKWSNHASTSKLAIIDETFFQRVEMIVDKFLARDMYVIINVHHYNQLVMKNLPPGEVSVDEEVVKLRLLNMWQQISLRFKNKSDKLIYEVLNEPNGKLNNTEWHSLMNDAVTIIRSNEPERILMVGPSDYNSIFSLAKFTPPKDRNIIISIHDYTPFTFTHQGASWTFAKDMKNISCCSETQTEEMKRAFITAANWNKSTGYPLHLGEFGANEKADMQSRVNYTKFARKLAENDSIGWTYWEFGSDFGAYDPKKKEWKQPLFEALTHD